MRTLLAITLTSLAWRRWATLGLLLCASAAFAAAAIGPLWANAAEDSLQGYGRVPVLTASENVEVVLQAFGRPAAQVRSEAAVAMTRVLLDGLGDRLVDRLSGGQQERVALQAEARRGAVVGIASHDRDVLAACDRVLWLADGAAS